MSFYRLTGMADIQRVAKASGTTLAVGDLCESDESAGNIIIAATNEPVKGVIRQAGASASTAAIEIDVAHPGDRFIADVTSGTMTAAYDGKYADIAGTTGAMGVTLTNSNNDVRVYYIGYSDVAAITFTTLETGGPFT